MSEENPYQEQTDANTSLDWLENRPPIDVDLEGMSEFADNMVAIRDFLVDHTSHLELLGSMPASAWEPQALPEAVYTMNKMLGNYTELQTFLAYLGIGIYNIGMAAQTVADLYSGTDGWSAASLNSVQWAFGQPGATRPQNVPPWLASGKTFWGAYRESLASGQPDERVAGVPAQWTPVGREVRAGVVVEVARGPGGQRMEIASFTVPSAGAGSYVITTIYDPSGNVLTRTTQHTVTTVNGNTTTTTQSTSTDGAPGGAVTRTVEFDDGRVVSEATVRTDAEGNPTGSTTVETDRSGAQTITTETYSGGEDEPSSSRTIEIGADTPNAGRGMNDPGAEALREIQERQTGR